MFAAEIRRAVEAAPRIKLDEITALLWKALGAGQVSESEAQALSSLIEARRVVPAAPAPARRAVGSRPRTDASMERRRRWAASGRLPPAIAARFTLAETAVLALVAAETVRHGDCRLAIGHLAAIVGVSETTVRNAIRTAGELGLLTLEERRQTAWRNNTNIVRIVSVEWSAWLRLSRREGRGALKVEQTAKRDDSGGGYRSSHPTPTESSRSGNLVDRHRHRAAGGQGRRQVVTT